MMKRLSVRLMILSVNSLTQLFHLPFYFVEAAYWMPDVGVGFSLSLFPIRFPRRKKKNLDILLHSLKDLEIFLIPCSYPTQRNYLGLSQSQDQVNNHLLTCPLCLLFNSYRTLTQRWDSGGWLKSLVAFFLPGTHGKHTLPLHYLPV